MYWIYLKKTPSSTDTSQVELSDKLSQEQENKLKRDQEQAVLEKPNKK